MRINAPSTATLTATRRTRQVGDAHADTLRHLSSGVKVTRGRDAPAALIAKEMLRTDRTRAEQVDDAAALARGATSAAEAALASVNGHLLELRALAGKNYGNTLGPAERAANQEQADRLIDDIDRLLTTATYKGRKLFSPPPGAPPVEPLALPSAGDIGSPSLPGSHVDTTAPNGLSSFDITSGGVAGGPGDNGYFLRTDHTGDGVLQATIPDFVSPSNPFGTAGITFRASDAQGAVQVRLFRFDDGRVGLNTRTADNAPGSGVGITPMPDGTISLRLTRSGNSFTGEASSDGVNWTNVGTMTAPLPPAARVGLLTTSNNVSQTMPASYNDVTLTPGTVPPAPPPSNAGQIPRPDVGTIDGDPTTPEQTALVFNLGSTPGSLAALRLGRTDARRLGTSAFSLDDLRSDGKLDLRDPAHPDDAARVIDASIRRVTTIRGRIANFQRNVADPMGRQGEVLAGELADAGSQVADTDVAESSAELARLDVLRLSNGDALRVGLEQSRLALNLLG